MLATSWINLCVLGQEMAKNKAKREYRSTLPIERQIALQKIDKEINREAEQHRKALEIANAGRAKNFFGN